MRGGASRKTTFIQRISRYIHCKSDWRPDTSIEDWIGIRIHPLKIGLAFGYIHCIPDWHWMSFSLGFADLRSISTTPP